MSSSLCLFSVGRSSKLGLSGRPSDVVGILATSKLYTLGDKTMAFLPQVCNLIRLKRIDSFLHTLGVSVAEREFYIA